jgi:hypothetical protein
LLATIIAASICAAPISDADPLEGLCLFRIVHVRHAIAPFNIAAGSDANGMPNKYRFVNGRKTQNQLTTAKPPQ